MHGLRALLRLRSPVRRLAHQPGVPRCASPWRLAGSTWLSGGCFPCCLCLLTPGSPRQDKEAKDSGKPIRVVYYKWLELVAVHSDAWLMSVAFFFAAKAEKPDRSATFVLRPRPAPPLTPRHAWRRPD